MKTVFFVLLFVGISSCGYRESYTVKSHEYTLEIHSIKTDRVDTLVVIGNSDPNFYQTAMDGVSCLYMYGTYTVLACDVKYYRLIKTVKLP